MRSPKHTLGRLLLALEELGRREDAALACGDAPAFLELQHRAQPLVQRVSLLAGQIVPLDESLRVQGRSLITAQQRRLERLQAFMSGIRDELGMIEQARLRTRLLRPAYGTAGGPTAHGTFSAHG